MAGAVARRAVERLGHTTCGPRHTLAQVLAYVLISGTCTAMNIEPDGTATVAEVDDTITYLTVCRPGTDGLYDLGIFGWTLERIAR